MLPSGTSCELRGERKSLGWADVQTQGLCNRLWSQGQALLGWVPSPCSQQASRVTPPWGHRYQKLLQSKPAESHRPSGRGPQGSLVAEEPLYRREEEVSPEVGWEGQGAF